MNNPGPLVEHSTEPPTNMAFFLIVTVSKHEAGGEEGEEEVRLKKMKVDQDVDEAVNVWIVMLRTVVSV